MLLSLSKDDNKCNFNALQSGFQPNMGCMMTSFMVREIHSFRKGARLKVVNLLFRASSYVADFNTRNRLLTQKLLKQGYLYHKLRKTFSKFYRRYYDLVSKFQVGLKSLLCRGLSEPDIMVTWCIN